MEPENKVTATSGIGSLWELVLELISGRNCIHECAVSVPHRAGPDAHAHQPQLSLFLWHSHLPGFPLPFKVLSCFCYLVLWKQHKCRAHISRPASLNSIGSKFSSQGHFHSLELLNISQFLFCQVVRLKTAPRSNFSHMTLTTPTNWQMPS